MSIDKSMTNFDFINSATIQNCQNNLIAAGDNLALARSIVPSNCTIKKEKKIAQSLVRKYSA